MSDGPRARDVILVVVLSLVLRAIFVVRHGLGRWIEQDSSLMTLVTLQSIAASTVTKADTVYAYSWGSGYQLVLMTLVSATGLSVQQLQFVVLPFWGSLLVLPLIALYGRWGVGPAIALVAAVLVVLEPNVLFVSTRGTHEKFTLMLFLLLVLSVGAAERATSASMRLRLLLVATLLALGMALLNFFFASIALTVIMTGVLLGRWLVPRGERTSDRSTWLMLGVAATTAFLVTLLYRPARAVLFVAEHAVTGLVALAFGHPNSAPHIGGPVLATWTSPQVAIILLSYTALLVLLAALGLVMWVRQRGSNKMGVPREARFALAMVPLGILALLVDVTGFLGANLALRLLPYFLVLAAPFSATMLSRGLRGWVTSHSITWSAVAIAVCVLAVGALSEARATNEPTLSNKWTFYEADEVAVVRFDGMHHSPNASSTWADVDERLRIVSDVEFGEFKTLHGGVAVLPSAVVSTDLVRHRMAMFPSLAPAPFAKPLVVYTNGDAQLIVDAHS